MDSPDRQDSWLKRYLPKNLFGRTLLIIMLPIALMQIIVAYIFFDAHWQTVTASLSNSVAADISVAVELYQQDPGQDRSIRLDAMLRPNMQLSVALEEEKKLPTATRKAFFSSLDRTLRRALMTNLKNEFWFDTTRYPNHIDIRVSVDEGVLRFIVPRERVFASTGFIFLFWLIMATVLLSLVSILFILNQARPIVKLARATEDFGKGRSIGDFKPSGATEVRQAGRAFMEMRGRILRHIQQRTAFLAGVSHDLRTPLTRLNLHLALNDDEESQAAQKDVQDMETMLDGYLDFARGISRDEVETADMTELLQRLVEKSLVPKPKLTVDAELSIRMRQLDMTRALANLIDNARSFGSKVEISAIKQNDRLVVFIDDDGPGIPEDKRGDAIKPFFRLDESRNQNVKGVGLGLSITSDIVQSHGGVLSLEDSPLGGLRCRVSLPL